MLLVQDMKDEGVVLEKVKGERNPADLMTKSLGIKGVQSHSEELKL